MACILCTEHVAGGFWFSFLLLGIVGLEKPLNRGGREKLERFVSRIRRHLSQKLSLMVRLAGAPRFALVGLPDALIPVWFGSWACKV